MEANMDDRMLHMILKLNTNHTSSIRLNWTWESVRHDQISAVSSRLCLDGNSFAQVYKLIQQDNFEELGKMHLLVVVMDIVMDSDYDDTGVFPHRQL